MLDDIEIYGVDVKKAAVAIHQYLKYVWLNGILLRRLRPDRYFVCGV